jgi:hypothetical protein
MYRSMLFDDTGDKRIDILAAFCILFNEFRTITVL